MFPPRKIELPATVGVTRLRTAKLLCPLNCVVDPLFEKVVTPPPSGPVARQLITACGLVTAIVVLVPWLYTDPTPVELVTVPSSACPAAGLAPTISAVAIASVEHTLTRLR